VPRWQGGGGAGSGATDGDDKTASRDAAKREPGGHNSGVSWRGRRRNRLLADRISRPTANGRSSRRYRPASRRGSSFSRCAHSSPSRCIVRGARGVTPAIMVMAPPQPTNHASGSSWRSRLMSCSCRGKPRATNTRSGPAAATLATVRCTPSSVLSNPNGGDSAPAMRRPGDRATSVRAALSGTPSAPPSRKTDRPARAAAALSVVMSDDPATRSGSTSPTARAAHTRGIPSATTSDPVATRLASSVERAAALAMSMFTVTMEPPRPAAQASDTKSMTSASVSASNSRPQT
jgi:hypothetical protein